jgi:1,4-alpha-glucan branching enzyme
VRIYLCTVILTLLPLLPLLAQPPVKKYFIKNGKMCVELSKQINEAALDSFVTQYNLADLDLKQFIKTAVPDSLQKLGWTIDANDASHILICKPFMSADNLNNPADRILFAEKHASFAARFPVVSSAVRYGYNRFRNKSPFATVDSVVTFFLRNNQKASRVQLAGSFTNWQYNALNMIPTDSGWIVPVKLGAGKYWYKFVIDGDWRLDQDNQLRESDGEGNINSVFYQTNTTFKLNGFTNAKRVYLAGSFNNWEERNLAMVKTAEGWQLPLYLAEGTHTYRYIVDGKWMADPANQERLPNEFNDYNSVVRIGKPYLFKLDGYSGAKQVILSGSFNGWHEKELYMTKTATGWELPYVLGPGNHAYKFIVDGKWITDPINTTTAADNQEKSNSYIIVAPNYEFHLKGFPNAKAVYLAGDFNDWSPNTFPMQKQGDEWIIPVHLSIGKHRYKFVVDGKWIRDPANKLWEQNEHGTGNSIIWIDK